MSDQVEQPPEIAVKKRRGPSIVWLIPLVAAAIALWLGYRTLSEQGPEITITFKTGEGLEAGKTKIKYKDLDWGQVETVALSDDASHVIVTARMDKSAERHLTDRARFWVVRPRLSAGGVSGLGTLVSGAYIGMDIGQAGETAGEFADSFVGLEVPPAITSDVPGTTYTLHSATLGSIGRQSPIYFRGIVVGQILDYRLADDNRSVDIIAFVRAPHDTMVKKTTAFWNASGIDVSVGANGVDVEMESLTTLIGGGVAFETPLVSMKDPPAENGAEFSLYRTLTEVARAQIIDKIPYLLYFDGSVRGLEPGAPVDFRGIRLGSVRSVKLNIDREKETVSIPVVIDLEPDRIQVKHTKDQPPYAMMEKLIERGLRAELTSANLLTGQLMVALDFYPGVAPARLKLGGEYPEIPTVPTRLAAITRSVTQILDRIAALPLEGIAGDAQKAIQAVQALVADPALRQSLNSLSDVTKATNTVINQAQSTLSAAEKMITPGSPLQSELAGVLRELKGAARSIRVLADYLERHPDSLIYGKGGPPPK